MMIYSIKIIIIQEKRVDKIHKELFTVTACPKKYEDMWSQSKLDLKQWMVLLKWITNASMAALKITTGPWSLTVAKAFVTAEKFCQTVNLTANT